MSQSEKAQMILALLIFVGYPLPFLIIGGQFLLLAISIIGITTWFLVLQLKICPDCVNFSCPLNRVPKDIIDEFLRRNPVMQAAWEKAGYELS